MDQVKDWLTRAGWTALYVFVAAFVGSLSLSGNDITSLEVLKAAVIAAALAAAKTLLVNQFGDPAKVRSQLVDIGIRSANTFWQTAVGLLVAAGNWEPGTLKIAFIAAATNTLARVVVPPVEGVPMVLAEQVKPSEPAPGDGDPDRFHEAVAEIAPLDGSQDG